MERWTAPPPLPPLSEIQFECLVALVTYQEVHGWAPSLRELRARLGVKAVSHVAYLLDSLEAKGYIARMPRAARALRVLHDPR